MILHRVEATNVGPFTGAPAVAGPFAPGLNVLSAPNETGKTTLLKAAGRALFDRHTCKDAEIRSLRPAGTDLAPRIGVEFETAEGRFKVEKTFLQTPTSVLHARRGEAWQPVAEGDDADNRLTRLLQSRHPGKGATKAAHWGLLGYLWMRQGELAEWPQWTENPAGQLVQSLLVKVEIDPFIETVRGRMWSAYQENFTTTGQPKAGGALREAQETLARVETDLARVAEERRRLSTDEEEYTRLSEALPDLETEHARHRQDAAELQESARRAEVVAEEVRRRQHELTTTQDRLRAVQADRDALERYGRELEEACRQLSAAEAVAIRAGQEAADRQTRLAEAERAVEAGDAEWTRLQTEAARVGRLTRHRQGRDNVERLTRTLERIETQAAHVEKLARTRAELPAVPPARLQQFQKLEESIRQRRAQLDALGLTVELTPAADAADIRAQADDRPDQIFPPLSAGGTHTVRAVRDLTLDLPGWGRLRMRSGAAETRTLDDAAKKDEVAFRAGLAEHGANTLAELRDLAERGRGLDAELAAARRALAAMLDPDTTPDAPRQRLAAESRQLAVLAAELDLPLDKSAPSRAELEAAEQAVNVRLDQTRAARESFSRQWKQARETAHEAAAAREASERALMQKRADADGLERHAVGLGGRYPDGVEGALDVALFAYAETKFALQKAQEKLPPDAATLGERNRRAAAAAAQVGAELDARHRARDEIRGRLEWLGSQALYPRETELLAEQAALMVQLAHARVRSHAARLVHDLIERRKHAATRTVLGPLQERLGARFAEVSGERDRQVYLDESLRVRGLGRQESDLVAFDDLSQGAKEQLLLCLRLAVAEELAAAPGNGPQSLVLDDVLVNTDVARQRRVLDMLANAAAGGLQILVCTCHPDRYRGVGEIVNLRRG